MASCPKFGTKTTCEEVVERFSANIVGKTFVITGISPGGLGEALAKALASKKPAQLVFTARHTSKAEAVAQDIRKIHPSQIIRIVQMDLSSKNSICAAAASIIEMVSSIDVLINNAGVMAIPERTLSVDGHEMHFATNFLGPFLFTNILLQKLSNSARIINVTSGGYMICPIRFHDLAWCGDKDLPVDEQPDINMAKQLGIGELTSPVSYNPMLAYLHSNTATMLFTLGLNKRLQGTGVIAISTVPGVVITELQRHIGYFRNQLLEYKTATQGGASFLVAALDPTLDDHPGAYIDDCQDAAIVSDHVKNEEVAERLWEVAERMTGLKI
ncbi:hypothetical protein N7510_004769 [Penicillium lagena]|uniref:uncharacterized protein n=1 Tax=Penicillium lagena TaxID=94218 RepID=UPI002541E024|nr:uncharacterized protein N7510_004769 [Penicillium lagena]KAJ5620785.1 hypothetical protein N7510_004769 [Penicillium lagena]